MGLQNVPKLIGKIDATPIVEKMKEVMIGILNEKCTWQDFNIQSQG